MDKKTKLQNLTDTYGAYITTTEFAKLCGVSRFTIINWAKQGRIKSIMTAGKHRRIPISEVEPFLEKLQRKEEGNQDDSWKFCWEFSQEKGFHRDCGNCLLYKKGIEKCHKVIQEFGKEKINNEADCFCCDYYDEFFRKEEELK